MPNVDVGALVDCNLKGWAEGKLQKLEDAELSQLAVAMGAAGRGDAPPDGKGSVIKAILQRKKERGKERAPSPLTREVAKEEEKVATVHSNMHKPYKTRTFKHTCDSNPPRRDFLNFG